MKFGLNDYSKLVFITLSESIKVVGAQQQVSDHDSGIIKQSFHILLCIICVD